MAVETKHVIKVTGGTANTNFQLEYSYILSIDGGGHPINYPPGPTLPVGSGTYNNMGEFTKTVPNKYSEDLDFRSYKFSADTIASGSTIGSHSSNEEKTWKINLTSAPVDPGGS